MPDVDVDVDGPQAGPFVAGIDGCRGRWLVVTGSVEPTGSGEIASGLRAELVDRLDQLVAKVRTGQVAVACVDMPIGLVEAGPRAADREARKLLGPRRSTVFPAPVRAVLGANDYAEACRLSRAAHGKALSKQTFNLLTAIGELDRLLRPEDNMIEAHPELAFARLDHDRPLPPKKTAEGRDQRQQLLQTRLGPAFANLLDQARRDRLPIEDLLDATALVITARHVVAGTERLVGDGTTDTTGKPIRVVW